jgi:hypothetical protein
MTEDEWRACTDPGPMLEFLRGPGPERKLRLFAVACCRRVWHLLINEKSRCFVEVAEGYADERATLDEMRALPDGIGYAHGPKRDAHAAASCCTYFYGSNIGYTVWMVAHIAKLVAGAAGGIPHPDVVPPACVPAIATEKNAQAALLRDIFGPLPFRPVAVHPDVLTWNDGLVVRLAQAIYDERRWEVLPLLADALLDAGCDNEEVLTHAREQGAVHVRGCWLLDLLLNKE